MAMDKVFNPDEHDFISPLVNFKTFKEVALKQRDRLYDILSLEHLRQFQYPGDIPNKPIHIGKRVADEEYCCSSDSLASVTDKLQETFQIQDDEAQKVLANLNVDHLAALNKRDILFRKKIDQEDIPADTELETLRLKRNVLNRFNPLKKTLPEKEVNSQQRERDVRARRNIHQRIKYGSSILKYADYFENDLKHYRSDGHKKVVINDIGVTVVICKPYNKSMEYLERRAATVRPYWRFLLRGESSLLELHSLFKCSSDYGTSVNEDEVPQIHDFNMFKYPSSFMFIHDTFYITDAYAGSEEALSQIDFTKVQAHIDISEPIRKWMSWKSNEFGPTKAKSFTDAKIEDLICRLGYPYVYVHQGCCEHVFFFTDLRLLDVYDYPMDFPQKLSDTSTEHYCITCHKRIADWIVECENFPISPVHMCDDCYKSFHYILKYKRNIDSKAYVYMDPSILQF